MATNAARAKGNVNRANKSYSYINSTTAYLKGINKFVLLLVGLFVFFVVGIIVYWIYKAIQKSKKGDDENPILVSGAIDASDPANSKSWVLPISSGSGSPNMAYTISFWIYIADWHYRVNSKKAILIKGVESNGMVTGDDSSPGIWLDSEKNNLIVATNVYTGKLQMCNVANIPIQKWVHVAYVLDNRTVDVYVDCKLERSCILPGVPLLNNHKLHLFPTGYETSDKQTGFLGQLSSLRYFSTALKPIDIAGICNSGPNATVGEQAKGDKPKVPDNYCPGRITPQLLQEMKDINTRQSGYIEKAMEQEEEQNTPQVYSQSVDIRWDGTPPDIKVMQLGEAKTEESMVSGPNNNIFYR